MSQPTGMGFATGQHYNHVAHQMQAYLDNNGGQTGMHAVHGGMFQGHRTGGPVFGSNYHHSGHHSHGGYNPMVNDNMGDFGRTFMRSLF